MTAPVPVARPVQACPICCGDLQPHTEDVADFISGEKFAIGFCAGCEMGTTVPAPRNIEAYYRERYYGNRHSFTARLCVWRRKRLVARFATAGDSGRLLDVGCGEGDFLDVAQEAGWNVAGMEVHGRGHQRHKVYGSLSEASERAPYDCITMWHVLEHVPEPMGCLEQLRSMLSREGVLLVAVPDFGGLQSRIFGRHWLHLDVPRHLHHFTLESLKRALRAAGFEILSTAHQELEYDWFGWIQSALNSAAGTPNVLFEALTGKPRRVGRLQVAASFAAATMMAAPALALTGVSTFAGRGGTLIAAARPRRQSVVTM